MSDFFGAGFSTETGATVWTGVERGAEATTAAEPSLSESIKARARTSDSVRPSIMPFKFLEEDSGERNLRELLRASGRPFFTQSAAITVASTLSLQWVLLVAPLRPETGSIKTTL